MIVSDRSALIRKLQAVGYYRLCAYWHPFKKPDGSFAANTEFDTVWWRYRFDRQLRIVVMDALERVEVAIRAALVHELAMRGGPFVHIDIRNFPRTKPEQHARFLGALREGANYSSEEFVKHFQANYDEFPNLPIWAVSEIMTFGSMFTLFNMSERRVQNAVAPRFEVHGTVLRSWLQTLNYIRNICAHHSRLWNRTLAIRPVIPDAKNDARWHGSRAVSNKRLFAVLTLLNQLLSAIAPESGWRGRLFDLFDGFPEIPLKAMGIPEDWRGHDLWA